MPADSSPLNVATRLAAQAAAAPERIAVAAVRGSHWRTVDFGKLDADATAIARALIDRGMKPGTRLALLVPPSPEFVTLVFALLRSGATTILVDPGMGKKHLIDCLAAAEPEGFIAVSRAQAARVAHRRRFPKARINVTIGRRWFWGGPTLNQLLAASPPVRRDAQSAEGSALPATHPTEPAAIIFTSGSTGPPKGVLYTHEMFETQAAEIQRQYNLEPGGADLACFALFGLFNAATGVTTVFPDMDFSRPAAADPRKLLAAANRWQVTQAFASPTVWDKLSRHCKLRGERIPTLRKVFSCGAPVCAEMIQRTLDHVAAPGAEMHTPYGATEALPVSTIEAQEILGETATTTAAGAGVCVGRKFDSIEWRIVRIIDDPIASIDDAEELPPGEIGELIVRGPQVSPAYVIGVTEIQPPAPPGGNVAVAHGSPLRSDPRAEPGADRANALSKIRDGATTWHRMGDVGYFDDQQRFWYCGRKSHRVETTAGTLYTECVECVFNAHHWVRLCALVGVGPRGSQTPVIVFEPRRDVRTIYPAPGGPATVVEAIRRTPQELAEIAAQHSQLEIIKTFLQHKSLPVDVRHNAKINREALVVWAAKQLERQAAPTKLGRG